MFVNLGAAAPHTAAIGIRPLGPIGHSSPASFLGNLSPIQAQQFYAEYSVPVEERLRRALLGLPTTGLLPSTLVVKGTTKPKSKPGKWTDEDRRQQLARLKQREDDAFRREQWAILKKRLSIDEIKFRREHLKKLKARLGLDEKLSPTKKRDLYWVAIHESGHGFICAYDKCPFESLSIIPNEKSLGRLEWANHCYPVDSQQLRVTVAGPLAECFWRDMSWTPGAMIGDATDVQSIIAMGFWDSEEFSTARREVLATLRQHWPVVLEIATQLMEQDIMTGDEVAEIVRKRLEAQR